MQQKREREREKENKLNGKNTYTSHTSRSDSTIITSFWQWETIWVDEITKTEI
jgi:hypothetical protein